MHSHLACDQRKRDGSIPAVVAIEFVSNAVGVITRPPYDNPAQLVENNPVSEHCRSPRLEMLWLSWLVGIVKLRFRSYQ
jgi:hypothetical protein